MDCVEQGMRLKLGSPVIIFGSGKLLEYSSTIS